MKDYIYLYGMVMSTWNVRLSTPYPREDGYGEICEKYHLLGGETGTAATVLNSLGVPVKLAGTHLGRRNERLILDYFQGTPVDTSELVREDFEGVVDYALITGHTRTCFGEWAALFGRAAPFYEPPRAASVEQAVCVGADPFFGPEIVRLALRYGKPYGTIDCPYDSSFHRCCAVNVLSHQYLKSAYPDQPLERLFQRYTEHTAGLVIFTQGGRDILYGRKGQPPRRLRPFQLNIVSTLGAGDSFKAGALYGLYHRMEDDALVRYAAAVAGIACTKFPIPLNPPTKEEVEALLVQAPR